MSEEEKTPVQEPQAVGEAPQNVELRTGYIVGVSTEGRLVFQVTGEKPGLVELVGVHKYAEWRVEKMFDEHQGEGVPALMQQNQALAKMIEVLRNEVAKLTSAQSQSRIVLPK